jgi:hypothetical protein
VQCPESLQIFLRNGGLYSMLDIIEIASYPVRCLYLAALTDICDNTFCGPCFCTWRGADKKRGLMSLLTTIWREEEDRIGIKRHADNSIAGTKKVRTESSKKFCFKLASLSHKIYFNLTFFKNREIENYSTGNVKTQIKRERLYLQRS